MFVDLGNVIVDADLVRAVSKLIHGTRLYLAGDAHEVNVLDSNLSYDEVFKILKNSQTESPW